MLCVKLLVLNFLLFSKIGVDATPDFQLFRANIARYYWTGFINISYVYNPANGPHSVLFTDNSETGRYATNEAYQDVRGVAVQMKSKESLQTSADNRLEKSSRLRIKTTRDYQTSQKYATDSGLETSTQNNFDGTGCFPPFLDNYPHNETWIAVVKRGNCTFNEKVQNAFALNASGIIIYDDEDGKTLQSMKGKI